MIVSDRDLFQLQADHSIVEPWNDDHVQPGSIDLTLGDTEIDATGQRWQIRDYLVIHPDQFKLGTTHETVYAPPAYSADVKGRSSWARLGLMVECAGFIDPGFSGKITLELKNLSSRTIRIPLGARVCQVRFQLMTSPAERPYGTSGLGSHYQGQSGATASVLYTG